MLHQAAGEFKNIKIVHYNYPFDKICNPYITINMHPSACYMSKAAIAARKQNNYWEMSSLLYENQPKNIEKMKEIAEKAGLNIDIFMKDFESAETKALLSDEIDKALELDIDATPTMYINGEKYVGVKPYYELKNILEKNGAKRK
jgi:protein-disulfide isomerase